MIETARLILRRFTDTDAKAFAALRVDAEVMRYITGRPATPEEIARSLRVSEETWRERGFGRLAMIRKADNEFIGWSGFGVLDNTTEIETGYGMKQDCWGQGYATEATRACLRYGFEEIGLPRIVAVALPANTASWRVMQKLGMSFEKNAHHYGFDVVYYAMNREEFRADDSPYQLHKSESNFKMNRQDLQD